MAEPASEESARRGVNAWFFTDTSLEDLLAQSEPLADMADIALDDLTPDEAQSFLLAVEE